MKQAQNLIQQLDLMPHPEGGGYRELHRSPAQVPRQDGAERSALTAILFLLPAGAISCWHRVIGGDEAWTHIDGATLELFQFRVDGTELQRDAVRHRLPGVGMGRMAAVRQVLRCRQQEALSFGVPRRCLRWQELRVARRCSVVQQFALP